MRKYLFVMAQEGHPWGGSELLWSSAAEKLVRRGNEVRVSVKDWGTPVPQIEKLRAAGCRIVYRRYRLPPFFTRQVRKFFPGPDYKMSHVDQVGQGVDLVVISQGANYDGLEFIEATQRTGHKYAIISQCAAEQWWPHDDLATKLAKLYENASGAYFVSQANLELSCRQFGSPIRNGKVVRNPFNVRYSVHPSWPESPEEGLSLGCVARLEVNQKGQDLLIQVLNLPHWRKRRICLSLIGKGLNERWLRRAVEELNLTNVVFAGHVDDIEQVWRGHHALVLASRYEGMPLAVVEAMLCGRPCIATDVGGNRELIRDGVNGFLAKAPTVELVDEAMNRAWENHERLKEMGCIAATDVRKWVSEDPGGDFALELERLAGRGKGG
jgi:glycosyltransferase involved in cell wall biosynthesis